MAHFLAESESFGLEHFDLECYVTTEGREMLRLMLQEHFDLGALRERRLEEVRDAADIAYRSVERDHERPLATVVGPISIGRLAYRHRGQENLYLADAAANLPVEVHSHAMRQLAAIESSRGSFAEAKEAICRASGQTVGQRQVEQLARAAAVDFEAFYSSEARPEASGEDVVVITADGKGVVMREADLRPGTAKAAAKAQNKLKTRLSPGEKANRKRMAEVVGVYTVTPLPRSPEEVLASHDEGPKAAPEAKDKWLAASVEHDAADVIARAFAEADSRDPKHSHDWVALVDGANHQIDRIKAEAKSRGIEITIVVDCVHVLGVPCPHCAPIFPRWSLGPSDAENPCRCWVSAADVPCRRRTRWYLDRVTTQRGRAGTACFTAWGRALAGRGHARRYHCGASVSRRSARPQRCQAAALVTPSRSAISAHEQP